MSKPLVFIKSEKFEEMADDFANNIYGVIEGIYGQPESYREKIPKNKKKPSQHPYRYRIDPKYIGYDGVAWTLGYGKDAPVPEDCIKHAAILLIEEKLREKFNNPDLTLECDSAVARVYTHFLIYF